MSIEIARRHIFETNRGARLLTWTGRIVGYPIVKLSPDREDVHRYVRDLGRSFNQNDARL